MTSLRVRRPLGGGAAVGELAKLTFSNSQAVKVHASPQETKKHEVQQCSLNTKPKDGDSTEACAARSSASEEQRLPTTVKEKKYGIVSGISNEDSKSKSAIKGTVGLPVATRSTIGYKLNPAIFEFVKDMFEETYGFFLTRDVFADRKRSLLKESGFPNAAAQKDHAVFIDVKWTEITNALRWANAAKVIAIFLVPEFKEHTWFITLERRASHHISLPVGDGLFVDRKGGLAPQPPIPIHIFFLYARYADRTTKKMIELKLPPLRKMIEGPFPSSSSSREILPMQKCDFLEMRPKQHISVEWFLKWGPQCLPPKLLNETVTGLLKGFPTRYRGGDNSSETMRRI